MGNATVRQLLSNSRNKKWLEAKILAINPNGVFYEAECEQVKKKDKGGCQI